MRENLATAFDLFRRGMFAEARAAALAMAAENPQSFWAYYLAAVSAAFEPNLPEFEKYLFELDQFETQNVYLHYLKAYYSLLQRDIEKALWHYLEIANDSEGWLARALLKKFRKVKELKDVAFRVADFIVLPAELPPAIVIEPHAVTHEQSAAQPGWQFGQDAATKPEKVNRNRLAMLLAAFPYRRVFIAGFFLFALTAIVTMLWLHFHRQTREQIPEMQIADSAAVMPVPDTSKILYRYKTRAGIIDDFEHAKNLLKERKVNQARYLFARLLNSNADFQSREKSRIFSGFIADPDYTDFNDNLNLKDLFKHITLRRDSLVVIAGELRDAAEEAGGTQYQMLVREEGEEYRVNIFKPATLKENAFQTEKKSKQIQVYGRFKGVVGAQKTIYLEALRVWR